MPQETDITLSILQFSGLFVGAMLFIIALFIFVAFWMRKYLKRKRIEKSLEMTLFLITVPKDVEEKEEEAKKEEKDLISVTEQMYAGLFAIAQKGMKNLIEGKNHICLEIVGVSKEISFYISCPKYISEFIEKQVHSQYPKANIEEVEDFNIFTPNGFTAAARLRLKNKYYLPIKTYQKLESDPLNALTNALSKLQENEGATIQILFRPAKGSWRIKGPRIARKMQQGRSFEQVTQNFFLRILFGAGKLLGDIVRDLFTGKSKDEMEKYSYKHPEEAEQPIKLSPMQEETVKALEEKAAKMGFETIIRLVTSSYDKEQANMHLSNLYNAFIQFEAPFFNGFKKSVVVRKKKLINNFIFRYFTEESDMVLNTEELASIFHLPIRTTETPNIKWLKSKKAVAPPELSEEGVVIGKNIYRGVERLVRVKRDDRRRHIYALGKTGTGKSTLLFNMAAADILAGEGVAVVDPHGDLIEELLAIIPKERADDVVLFDPGDTERPMGLNMLEFKVPEQKDFVVSEMIAIFQKLFPPEIVGPMFEHNMRNVMLTLMEDTENPGTITEIPRMFTDTEYQNYKLTKVKDPVVRAFWEKEMAKTSDFHKSEMLGYLISKVGQFVENTMMRNIIGQQKSAFDCKEIMDKGKILLVNLSKGKTGEINSSLLGLIIVSKFQMAAMGRVDTPEEQRRDFYLYIDEFQNFTTDSIATILSEARKYRLCLVTANQYIAQLEEKIRDAMFGNVGTLLCFRIGAQDAEFVEKEFTPVFNQFDLVNIDRFNAYIKLMINQAPSRPFSMETLPPQYGGTPKVAEAVRQLSRLKYGRDKEVVEKEIEGRAKLGG